jgi:hypothetical protein
MQSNKANKDQFSFAGNKNQFDGVLHCVVEPSYWKSLALHNCNPTQHSYDTKNGQNILNPANETY